MELLLAFVAVLVGAVVQGSVGFGLALVAVPVVGSSFGIVTDLADSDQVQSVVELAVTGS